MQICRHEWACLLVHDFKGRNVLDTAQGESRPFHDPISNLSNIAILLEVRLLVASSVQEALSCCTYGAFLKQQPGTLALWALCTKL